jgi:HAD superfamily hydrolase (TIGR01484 family)
VILIAYAVAGIIGMIPVTPGGLGLVEASLTGLLVLAQVDSSQAVLATLTYRLASYRLPLFAGPIAYGLFRIRYRSRSSPPLCGNGADPGRHHEQAHQQRPDLLALVGRPSFNPPLGCHVVRTFPLLVATDLDGTIVRSDGTISERTVAAFVQVEAAGARFVLVTGRPPRVMAKIAATFGHRGTAICSNGALTYDMRTDTVTARHLIPPEALAAAAQALRAAIPGIGIAVERPDGRAADDVYQAIMWDTNESVPRPGEEALFAEPAAKLLGRHLGYSPDELLALAAPVLVGLVSVSHSNGKGLIEAAAIGVSKATAVAELAADHSIGREAVIAFGDMPNDLPMMAWAGTSCAVANAHPDVLAAATRVIGANDADGVAQYLEELYP